MLIDRLLADGAKLQVHDPEAMENVRRDYGDRLVYAEHPYDALDGADALAIVTEWKQFLRPDLDEMRKPMKTPVIFDGRNLYEPAQMKAAGFTYHCIGRAPSARRSALPGQAARRHAIRVRWATAQLGIHRTPSINASWRRGGVRP